MRHGRWLLAAMLGGACTLPRLVPAQTPPNKARTTVVLGQSPAAYRRTWEKRRAKRIAFYLRTTLGVYRKYGRHSAKWDTPVAALFTLYAHNRIVYSQPNPEVYYRMMHLASAAIAAGCRDPLVYDLRGVAEANVSAHPRRQVTDMALHCAALQRSHYPAYIKAYSLLHAFAKWPSGSHAAGLLAHRRRLLHQLFALFPQVLSEPGLPREEPVEISARIEGKYQRTFNSRRPAFKKLYRMVKQQRPNGVVRQDMKGIYYLNHAWDARGSAMGGKIGKAKMVLFEQRLMKAGAAFARAYELDPHDFLAPTLEMVVDMGTKGSAVLMNHWLRCALRADPDDFLALSKKKRFLYRRWWGTRAKLLAFAREMQKSKNYRARIPFMACLIYNHVAAVRVLLDPVRGTPWFKANPRYWPRVRKIFGPYLKRHPHDYYDRTWYAQYAAWFGHYRKAQALLRQCHGHARPAVFGGAGNEELLQKFIRRVAAKAAAEEAIKRK